MNTMDYQSPVMPHPADLQSAVGPLRWIFWGSILLVLNITFTSTTNGSGFRCDILDDTVGMILVMMGVYRLAKFPVKGRFPGMMAFVIGVCWINLVETVIDHFVFSPAEAYSLLTTIFSLVKLAAAAVFFTAMVRLCETYGLRSAASWRTTRLLYVLIYVVPLGLLYAALLIGQVTGATFHFDLGPAGLLLMLVFLIPLIHFFVSTSRMRREAEVSLLQ